MELLDFSVSIVAFIFSILSKYIKNVGAVFPISTLIMHIFKRINGHISTNEKESKRKQIKRANIF